MRRGLRPCRQRSRRSCSGHKQSSESSDEDKEERAKKTRGSFSGTQTLWGLDINKSSFDVVVESDKFNSPSLKSSHSSPRTPLYLRDIHLPEDHLLLRLPLANDESLGLLTVLWGSFLRSLPSIGTKEIFLIIIGIMNL